MANKGVDKIKRFPTKKNSKYFDKCKRKLK